MKNSFLSILLAFTSFYILDANAQDASVSDIKINSLRILKQQIEDIDSSIQTLQTYVDNVIACGDESPPKHFNGTSCITINERDPNIELHGVSAINSSSCSDSNQIQQFNGSSWGCKTFN